MGVEGVVGRGSKVAGRDFDQGCDGGGREVAVLMSGAGACQKEEMFRALRMWYPLGQY